jgi:serine/threonine protein phosphatase 1
VIGEGNVLAWNVLTSKAPRAKPRVPEGQRVYAVGDVHGRADLLSALLGRIDADLQHRPVPRPVQVFLGDYIDRGPHSRQVIDLLVQRRRRHATLCLKGNHETFAEQLLINPGVLPDWRAVGGLNTLLSYGVKASAKDNPREQLRVAEAFRAALPESHFHFIHGLALSLTCGDFFFAHAGVRPGVPLRQQRREDLLWIREEFLLHEEDFGKIVVHGHTPAREPEIRPNRINIDTGAYATGRLTCLVLEDEEMHFI